MVFAHSLCFVLLSILFELGRATGPAIPNIIHVSTNYTVGPTDVQIYVNTTDEEVWIFLPLYSDVVTGTTGRVVEVFDEGGYADTNLIMVLCAGDDIFSNNAGFNYYPVIGNKGLNLAAMTLDPVSGAGVWRSWEI